MENLNEIIAEMKENLARAKAVKPNLVNDTLIASPVGGVYLVSARAGEDIRVTANPADAIALDRVNARACARKFKNGYGEFVPVNIREALAEYIETTESVVAQLEAL